MSTLLIRKTSKTSYAQAAKVAMLDSTERLTAWVDQMNDSLGWKKYAVENVQVIDHTIVDAGAINGGVVA